MKFVKVIGSYIPIAIAQDTGCPITYNTSIFNVVAVIGGTQVDVNLSSNISFACGAVTNVKFVQNNCEVPGGNINWDNKVVDQNGSLVDGFNHPPPSGTTYYYRIDTSFWNP